MSRGRTMHRYTGLGIVFGGFVLAAGLPTLIGFNDKVAVGALAAAAQRGLRVPEELSIAGFDDIDLAQATRPLLTTVRQPRSEEHTSELQSPC